jgi:hypothetical protein
VIGNNKEMPYRDFDPPTVPVSRLLRSKEGGPTKTVETSITPVIEREPVDHVVGRVGDNSCATAHASTLNRATDSHPARAPRSVLQLQKRYGNRYVERVLVLAREKTDYVGPSSNLARKSNQTGLPDGLKSGIESLSGISLDNVRVHHNSPQPAQLNALAYTQGSDIHVAPGQEQHLPHEAWHVVQQVEGRVKPTMQMKGGVPINEDRGLEREADIMAAKALQARPSPEHVATRSASTGMTGFFPVYQMKNAILAHNYENSESPLTTAIKFIAYQTDRTIEAVKGDIEYGGALNINKLTEAQADFRPGFVKAYIDDVTGSKGRGGDELQTGIGHLGNLENRFRGRTTGDFDGGHLLGYGWYKDWDLINSAKNIAPQNRAENRAIFGWKGAWGQEEITARDAAKVLPAVVTAYVNYATRNYVVSLRQLANVLIKPGSPTDQQIGWTAGFRFVTIDTRIPSQYALTYAPAGLLGYLGSSGFSEGENQNATLDIPARSGAVATVAYAALSGVIDGILRVAPLISVTARSRFGGGVVSSNADLYLTDIIGEILRVCHFAVAFLMYKYNWPLTAALAAVAYALGQGTIVGVVQRAVHGVTPESLAPLIDELTNRVEGAARSTLTVEGGLATIKTLLTEVSNFGYNTSNLLSGVKKKLKQD